MLSMFKKFPISKFVYDTPLYYIAVSQTLNLNNSVNLKQNLKIFLVVYQGPRWSCSVKKKEVKNLARLSLYRVFSLLQ
jgi:hypothetical protein